MPGKSFTGVLGANDSGGFLVEIPFDVKEVFGSARAPVRATVDGVTWRTTVAVYGGRYYLGIRRELRQKARIEDGDTIAVTLEADDAPRTVEVPGALKKAFQDAPDAKRTFDALSFTHRKEYARWIAEAKRDETRARRVAKALEMLRQGIKAP